MPHQAAPASTLWVSSTNSERSQPLTNRLHGTWLPPALTRKQRQLTEPLPDQPLLQDRLALSRVQAFVSIVFNRPTHRDKSRFERLVLALLWPSAFLVLGLALVETLQFSRST